MEDIIIKGKCRALNKKVKQIISIGCVIGVMLIIFMLSNQDSVDSRNVSNQFIHIYRKVVRHIPFMPRYIRGRLMCQASHYVRKIAHVAIYSLLGISSWIVLLQLSVKPKKAGWFALLICSIYAITDEWHQYYIAGRGAGIGDIILDSIGAIIGIGIGYLIKGLVDRFILNKKVKKGVDIC